MLLQEDSIVHHFAVISRVAQLLQQAVFTNENLKMGYGVVGVARDAGGVAPTKTVSSFGLTAQSSLTPGPEARVGNVSSLHSPSSIGSKAADTSVLQKPLQLSLVNTDKSLASLRQLGRLLDDSVRQLQVSVDAQLVDFYGHLKEKFSADLLPGTTLQERAAPSRDFPPVQLTSPSTLRPPSRQARQAADLGDPGTQLSADRNVTSCPGLAEPRAGVLPDIDAAEKNSLGSSAAAGGLAPVSATPGVGAVRTNGSSMAPTSVSTLHTLNTKQRQRTAHPPVGSSTGPQNVIKTRSIEEERAAASELQSFFSLLLEAALRLSGASAAAVYMDDSLNPTVGPSGAVVSGRARFLHCIAHSHGHFPSGISYAVSNLLTTVAVTGVAVNVHYSQHSLLPIGTTGYSDLSVVSSPRSLAAVVDGSTSKTGAPHSQFHKNSKHTERSLLDMYNGVVVPIKGIGCIVLANKEITPGTDAGASRFSLFDEHVAWSVALMCEAVLHRYERQLLLRVAWSPSCTSALRPYILQSGPMRSNANRSAICGSPPAVRNRRAAKNRVNSKHPFAAMSPAASADGMKPSVSDVDCAAVASLVFDPQNDIFSRRLTMVRTGDPQVLKTLPSHHSDSPSRGHLSIGNILNAVTAEAAKPTPSKVLADGAVFQAAAEYITNLESLLRRTISDSNTMHSLVDNYNKTMRQQEETIALLEAKVREQQLHLVQLERRSNSARLNTSH